MVNGTTWIPSPCLDSVPEDHGYMYAERMYEVIPVPYMIWKVVYTTIFSLVAVFMGWDCFVRLSYLHRHSWTRTGKAAPGPFFSAATSTLGPSRMR